LPWRGIDDPYAILVSEVMLQQTKVATALPYFNRFLDRFPTAQALAAAPEADCFAAWAGLGYYRRARNLRAAAKIVADSGWPDDLRSLPGVGDYTAAAIGSIAFGRQEACADGNVRRVMSRLAGETLSLADARLASAAMMQGAAAAEWNQAVMELGALVCTATPKCDECPLRRVCQAFARRIQAVVPAPVKATAVHVELVCACIVRGRRVALREALPGEWWQGMLVFPHSQVKRSDCKVSAVLALGLRQAHRLGSVRHTITRHRVTMSAYTGSGLLGECRWHSIETLQSLPLPAPQKKVAKMLEQAA
jgi:A/G-specific adenine glycosylase